MLITFDEFFILNILFNETFQDESNDLTSAEILKLANVRTRFVT